LRAEILEINSSFIVIIGSTCFSNSTQWRSKWGHAPQGAGLGDALVYFCSYLKTRFKQKFRLKYA